MVTSASPRIRRGRSQVDTSLLDALEQDEAKRNRAIAALRAAIGTSRINLARLRSRTNNFNIEELSHELRILADTLATANQVKSRLQKLNPADTGIKVIDRLLKSLGDEQGAISVRLNAALRDYAATNQDITNITRALRGRRALRPLSRTRQNTTQQSAVQTAVASATLSNLALPRIPRAPSAADRIGASYPIAPNRRTNIPAPASRRTADSRSERASLALEKRAFTRDTEFQQWQQRFWEDFRSDLLRAMNNQPRGGGGGLGVDDLLGGALAALLMGGKFGNLLKLLGLGSGGALLRRLLQGNNRTGGSPKGSAPRPPPTRTPTGPKIPRARNPSPITRAAGKADRFFRRLPGSGALRAAGKISGPLAVVLQSADVVEFENKLRAEGFSEDQIQRGVKEYLAYKFKGGFLRDMLPSGMIQGAQSRQQNLNRAREIQDERNFFRRLSSSSAQRSYQERLSTQARQSQLPNYGTGAGLFPYFGNPTNNAANARANENEAVRLRGWKGFNPAMPSRGVDPAIPAGIPLVMTPSTELNARAAAIRNLNAAAQQVQTQNFATGGAGTQTTAGGRTAVGGIATQLVQLPSGIVIPVNPITNQPVRTDGGLAQPTAQSIQAPLFGAGAAAQMVQLPGGANIPANIAVAPSPAMAALPAFTPQTQGTQQRAASLSPPSQPALNAVQSFKTETGATVKYSRTGNVMNMAGKRFIEIYIISSDDPWYRAGSTTTVAEDILLGRTPPPTLRLGQRRQQGLQLASLGTEEDWAQYLTTDANGNFMIRPELTGGKSRVRPRGRGGGSAQGRGMSPLLPHMAAGTGSFAPVANLMNQMGYGGDAQGIGQLLSGLFSGGGGGGEKYPSPGGNFFLSSPGGTFASPELPSELGAIGNLFGSGGGGEGGSAGDGIGGILGGLFGGAGGAGGGFPIGKVFELMKTPGGREMLGGILSGKVDPKVLMGLGQAPAAASGIAESVQGLAGFIPGMGGNTSTPTGDGSLYRTPYNLTDADISDAVVNTIAGEANLSDPRNVDAVINTMLNRVGSTGYGPSGNLLEVAGAPEQFAGFNRGRPNAEQAAMIRERIKAIASGTVPDITGGANEFRTASYQGPWMQKNYGRGVNIGGNYFAKNEKGVASGPYASFPGGAQPMPGATQGSVAAATAAGQYPNIYEAQSTDAETRKLPLSTTLKDQLQFAAEQSGVGRVRVYSGGQHKHGEGPRTGSTRHDSGNAGDVMLQVQNKDGTWRNLDTNNPADMPMIRAFTRNAVAAGVIGVGQGEGYMGGDRFHFGGDRTDAPQGPITWGAGEKSANTPQWLREEFALGLEAQKAGGAQQFAAWQAARANVSAQNSNTVAAAGAGTDAFRAPGLNIGYQGDPSFQYGEKATAKRGAFQGIVLHHTGAGTALQEMVNYGKTVDAPRNPDDPGAYGYHFYVGPKGEIIQGAPLSKRTNHIKPLGSPERSGASTLENANALGIALTGTSGEGTPAQQEAARKLAIALQSRYGIPASGVVGHGDLQSDRQHSEGEALKASILASQNEVRQSQNVVAGHPDFSHVPPSNTAIAQATTPSYDFNNIPAGAGSLSSFEMAAASPSEYVPQTSISPIAQTAGAQRESYTPPPEPAPTPAPEATQATRGGGSEASSRTGTNYQTDMNQIPIKHDDLGLPVINAPDLA